MRKQREEERLQRALVQHLRLRLPTPWLVFHVPNGGARSKAEAGIFKAMGVLAGVPDLFLIGPRVAFVGEQAVTLPFIVPIEIKAPAKTLKSGKQSKAKPRVSEAQDDVINALTDCGIRTLIVRDLDEAIRALQAMGVPVRGRAI